MSEMIERRWYVHLMIIIIIIIIIQNILKEMKLIRVEMLIVHDQICIVLVGEYSLSCSLSVFCK